MHNWRDYLLLTTLGLVIAGGIAWFQRSPGYMDADYYFAGGLQLANGKGFSEPYLWNYLDNPGGLPHPSNAYWMPLASIIAAVGMVIFRQTTWSAARIGFLIIASLIPPITYKLTYSLTDKRNLALLSGFIALFSGFYSVFIPVTDTFGIYMLLGGLFFLVAFRQNNNWRNLIMGLIAGLMHFARADGILWLFFSFLVVIYIPIKIKSDSKSLLHVILGLIICLVGYLGIMGPWFIRNELVFGSFLAPGGQSMFWLTDYNQIFSFQPNLITFNAWLQNGLDKAVKVRLWALNINFQNTLASQGSIFLFPLILIGIWKRRKDQLIKIACIAWLTYLVLMSIVFPFAGARGGFFHSGAAFQPLWWVLASIGLAGLVKTVGLKRKWNIEKASKVFMVGAAGLSIMLTVLIVIGKIYSPKEGWNNWSSESSLYHEVTNILKNSGDSEKPTVIVSNPPGFYLESGLNSIAVPDGDETNTYSVAQKFDANYLILENGAFPEGLNSLFRNPTNYPDFQLVGKVDGTLVFKIEP